MNTNEVYEMYCEKEMTVGIKAEYDFGRGDAYLTKMNDGTCFVKDAATGTLRMYRNYSEAAGAANMTKAKNKTW